MSQSKKSCGSVCIKKVSIIVPVYETRVYIRACLDALLEQEYRNLEILLIEDGSKDGCAEICNQYARKDSRIRVFHQKNQGAGSARNRGLQECTGAYVCFVDSDDVVSRWYVQELVQALEQWNGDIAVCHYERIYRNRRLPDQMKTKPGCYTAKAYLIYFLEDWNSALLWNKLFRKETLAHLRFEEGRKIDDEFFTYQAVIHAKRMVQIPNVLYGYRMRKNGVMGQGRQNPEELLQDRLDYLWTRWEKVGNAYPQLRKSYQEDLMDHMLRICRQGKACPQIQRSIKEILKHRGIRLLFGPASLKTKAIFFYNIRKR